MRKFLRLRATVSHIGVAQIAINSITIPQILESANTARNK
jgi:hypothetical protein